MAITLTGEEAACGSDELRDVAGGREVRRGGAARARHGALGGRDGLGQEHPVRAARGLLQLCLDPGALAGGKAVGVVHRLVIDFVVAAADAVAAVVAGAGEGAHERLLIAGAGGGADVRLDSALHATHGVVVVVAGAVCV